MNSRVAVNWLLLSGSLVTAAVLSELSVGLVMSQELIPLASWNSTGLTVRDSLMCHRLRRNFTTTWAREVVVSTSSLGMRDHEYGPKQRDELRILSLSVTARRSASEWSSRNPIRS